MDQTGTCGSQRKPRVVQSGSTLEQVVPYLNPEWSKVVQSPTQGSTEWFKLESSSSPQGTRVEPKWHKVEQSGSQQVGEWYKVVLSGTSGSPQARAGNKSGQKQAPRVISEAIHTVFFVGGDSLWL